MKTAKTSAATGNISALIGGLAALCLVLLASGIASLQAQGRSATAQAPAVVSVRIPPASGSGQVVLELSVTAMRKPDAGNLGGLVRLKRPGGGAVEVGRFSVLGSGSQDYQFDVTSALRQLGVSGGQGRPELQVEVALIDRSNGRVPAGAELVVASAQIATR